MSQVPNDVRSLTLAREGHKCAWCSMEAAELHHRRTRSIKDSHTHCPCNLLWLCGWGNHQGCHGWAHSNPFEARSHGLIVSRHAIPTQVPVEYMNEGRLLLTCDGRLLPMPATVTAEEPISPPVALHHPEPSDGTSDPV